jgi:hypothetical protein
MRKQTEVHKTLLTQNVSYQTYDVQTNPHRHTKKLKHYNQQKSFTQHQKRRKTDIISKQTHTIAEAMGTVKSGGRILPMTKGKHPLATTEFPTKRPKMRK